MIKSLFLTAFSISICLQINAQSNHLHVEHTAAQTESAIFGFANNDNIARSYGLTGISNATDGVGVNASANTGVLANGGSFGIFASSEVHAGYFAGNVTYTGTLTGPMSDRRLKRFVKNDGSLLKILDQLKVEKYFYKSDVFQNLNLSDRIQYGLVAQELEKIMPELVFEIPAPMSNNEKALDGESDSYKTINYMGLIPVALGSIKELSAQVKQDKVVIEKQNEKIDFLSQQIEVLSANLESTIKQILNLANTKE